MINISWLASTFMCKLILFNRYFNFLTTLNFEYIPVAKMMIEVSTKVVYVQE